MAPGRRIRIAATGKTCRTDKKALPGTGIPDRAALLEEVRLCRRRSEAGGAGKWGNIASAGKLRMTVADQDCFAHGTKHEAAEECRDCKGKDREGVCHVGVLSSVSVRMMPVKQSLSEQKLNAQDACLFPARFIARSAVTGRQA
jgi:hypothetical protein